MESTQFKPLKILNASAGSGKTFNLVKEYVQLLLAEDQNTIKFAQIIAMTFTNKAAFEMKSRIIQALDELSFPIKYGKKSDDYAIVIGNALGVNPEEIHHRAKIVLQNILHRYEDFHVMTIDKFNLKLIRSFSRDLNLSTDFEIIFNETEVIERVIDKMMSELDISDQNALTKIVFEYSLSNIEEGEGWNFRNNLIKFSEIIRNEKYNSVVEELMEKDFSFEHLKELKHQLARKKDHFVSECQKTYQIFVNEKISSSDLPGGIHTFNPISKLNTISTLPSKELFSTSFISKCQDVEVPKNKQFPSILKNSLLNLFGYWKKEVESFLSLQLYIRNYYNMALLQFMAKQLSTIRKDEQLIRISEFNTLISQLVKNEDAPFIYERLGTRFKHFLLDEFQDTSHLQWLNMVPLVHESISNNNQNLIVGDPKQSIYRFKNGVAEQFVALPRIYNPENDRDIERKSDYFEAQGEVKKLEDNWRSSPSIVNFNNHFFELLKNALSEENKSFYESIFQNPKSSLKGLVEIVSEPTKKDQEKQFDYILKWIKECESDGFKRGDICLLGEKNKECNEWAIFLTENGYDVVSADSLLVDSDLSVQLTIGYLKRRLSPMSENERRKFGEKYVSFSSENKYTDYKKYLKERVSSSEKKYIYFDDEAFLIENFGSSSAFFGKYENVYDLIQKFYILMGFNELTNPYLHHLADIAHQFDLNNGPDLKSFIDYYSSEGKKSAVQLPESENAIKIMSIHKSKGLEFPVVILPNMNLSTGINTQSKFLFESDEYILYSSASKNSEIDVIKTFSEIENNLILTDSINKCYVALTRPVERLYVYNQFDKAEGFGGIFNSTLANLNYETENFLKSEHPETGSLSITIGERSSKVEFEEKTPDSFFVPRNLTDKLWFPDISLKERKDLTELDSISDAQRYGNQLHLILSLIHFEDEIESCFQRLSKSGQIENEWMEKMKLEIKEIFNDDSYQNLFKGATEILSEQDIISGEFQTVRPDKLILKGNSIVILDYKTGLPNNKYTKQLKEYALILSEIGYSKVEAFLFYTATKKLEQVV